MVQRTADALLDALEGADGPVDLIDAYAAELPVLVIADIVNPVTL